MSLFVWFEHFLDFWADIITIFPLYFWKILDTENSFCNQLTFNDFFFYFINQEFPVCMYIIDFPSEEKLEKEYWRLIRNNNEAPSILDFVYDLRFKFEIRNFNFFYFIPVGF